MTATVLASYVAYNDAPPVRLRTRSDQYIKGFSANVRTIFDYFEFENEIEKMREANILYLGVSKFCD
jgi:type I restriction enzyme M protein